MCGSDEEIVHLTEDQHQMIQQTQVFVKEQMNGVLSENQVVRVCIEENFHMGAIHKYLKQFEMDAKYKGLDQFEWNTASTRTEKKQQAKDQIEARKNFKQEQEKRRLEFEERQARRERW